MGGIGVISNPRSRRNRRDPALAGRLDAILGGGLHLAPEGLDALALAAERLRDQEIDWLAINGGDGTLHTALTALLAAWDDRPLPGIALLRGGTMNTLASGMGIRGRPEGVLSALVAAAQGSRPLQTVERNALLVDGQAGFLFGNGVVSAFLERYYEAPEPSPASAAALLVRVCLSGLVRGPLIRSITAPVRCRVSADGAPWTQTEWITVGAGTVDDIGLRFRPFHLAPANPGHLHALGFGCSALTFIGKLPRIRAARPTEHPEIQSALCRELVIEADAPLDYMVDGDFHRGGQRLVVRVGPRIRFFVP